MDSLPIDLQLVIDRNTRITKNTSSTGDYQWKLISFRDQFDGMTLDILKQSEIIDFEGSCFEYNYNDKVYRKMELTDKLSVNSGYWIKMSGEISDKNILTGDTSNLTGNKNGIYGVSSRKLKGDVTNITGDISDLTGTIHSGLIGNVSNLHGDITPFTGNISEDLTGNLSNLKNNILQISSPHHNAHVEITKEIKNLYLDISGYRGNIDSIHRRLNVFSTDRNLYGIIPWNITGTINWKVYGDIGYLLPKIFQGSLSQNSDLYLEFNAKGGDDNYIKLDEETPILRRLIGEPSPHITGLIKKGYSGNISYLLPKIFQGTGLHNDIKFYCYENINNYHITESSEILRKLDGNVSGLTGTISSHLKGTISSDLVGTISSDLTGNISRNLKGDISDLTGTISSDLTGDISELTGTISEDLTGDISGLSGKINPNLNGDATGIIKKLDGTETGDIAQFKS